MREYLIEIKLQPNDNKGVVIKTISRRLWKDPVWDSDAFKENA